MSKLFLDANILMEIIFQRSKAQACVENMQQYNEFYLSTLSVHICMYYLEQDFASAIKDFWAIISDMSVLDLSTQIVFQSFDSYDQDDFEDWLQIYTAKVHEIPDFLTLDKKLYKKHHKQLNIILL